MEGCQYEIVGMLKSNMTGMEVTKTIGVSRQALNTIKRLCKSEDGKCGLNTNHLFSLSGQV